MGVSIYEIMEALRRFGPMSTVELVAEFDLKSTKEIHQQLHILEGSGFIKRVGTKRTSRNKETIVWDLAKDPHVLLRGYPTLYDVPYIKKKEERRIRLTGKGFKRWD